MSVVEEVQKYYGETLQSSSDLKTSACCPVDAMPEHIRLVLRDIHDEVKDRFYGCGSPVPPVLQGKTVLDLGCGTGRDCYILSRLGGPDSRIIGVDMTPEQLAVAEAHVDYHRQKFGYDSANTEFRLGYIEDLAALGIEDNSVDIITSNCVLNLADDKAKVFREIFRVLKPGGELYFSDVFCAQRIPEVLRKDPVLHGECLSGAMYTEDFRRLLAQLGCQDFRVMSKGKIDINDPEVEAKIGMYDFFSITIRAFKLVLEDRCEDYGQVAWYLGGIAEAPHYFDLDDHHRFVRGKPMLVCSNTARMLAQTRFAPYFRIEGDESHHFGLFDCGPADVTADSDAPCC